MNSNASAEPHAPRGCYFFDPAGTVGDRQAAYERAILVVKEAVGNLLAGKYMYKDKAGKRRQGGEVSPPDATQAN